MPGAKAVHVVEDAERGGDAHDPDDGQNGIEDVAGAAAYQDTENLRVNSGEKQDHGRDGHADE